MSEEESQVGVEVVPVETTYPLFRCPQGHEQRGSGETVSTNFQTGQRVTSGPVCIECWLPSLGAAYPTSEVQGE
jgi:hypothetical protein